MHSRPLPAYRGSGPFGSSVGITVTGVAPGSPDEKRGGRFLRERLDWPARSSLRHARPLPRTVRAGRCACSGAGASASCPRSASATGQLGRAPSSPARGGTSLPHALQPRRAVRAKSRRKREEVTSDRHYTMLSLGARGAVGLCDVRFCPSRKTRKSRLSDILRAPRAGTLEEASRLGRITRSEDAVGSRASLRLI
jgi:hypothetical protein